jgi:hypothetical protein
VITALDSNTIDILVKTYNRLRGANAVHTIASEHFYGPTVTIVRFLIALSTGTAQQKQVAEVAFTKAQDDYFNDLVNHTRESPQLLSAAREAVDFELKQLEPKTSAWKKVFGVRTAIRTPGRCPVGTTGFRRARGLPVDPLCGRNWSAAHRGYWSSVKPRVLGRLGWNSYGTDGAQRVAKVRIARSPKMAWISGNRCHGLPPAAVWIAW